MTSKVPEFSSRGQSVYRLTQIPELVNATDTHRAQVRKRWPPALGVASDNGSCGEGVLRAKPFAGWNKFRSGALLEAAGSSEQAGNKLPATGAVSSEPAAARWSQLTPASRTAGAWGH